MDCASTTSLLRRTAPAAAVLALALGVLALLVPTRAHAAPDTPYTITGHGWGHGIGMSQYGAKGFAEHGYTASQIITYYFQGTTIGPAPSASGLLDVELASGLTTTAVQVDGDGASIVRDGSPSVPLQVGDIVTISASGAALQASVSRAGADTPAMGAAPGTIVLAGPDGALKPLVHAVNGSTGNHYRGALIAVPDDSGTFGFGNRVAVESYLPGVVPSESPSSWPAAALQAQAIAARSYALATLKAGAFDLWADTRSQMYLGIEHEAATTSAAVTATAGQVALYGGAVIPTFFSSTSGGRTAAIQDVWGGTPRPYLVSVPDPYEVSPYSNWTPQTLTAAQVASKLGGGVGVAQSVSVTYNGSRRAASVTVVGTTGSRSVAASTVQVKLGLRSTFFRIDPPGGAPVGGVAGTGSIARLAARPKFGKPFVLRGKASATAEVWQRNGVSGPWARAAVLPVRKGAWVLRARIPRGVGVRQYQLRVGGRVVATSNVRPRVH